VCLFEWTVDGSRRGKASLVDDVGGPVLSSFYLFFARANLGQGYSPIRGRRISNETGGPDLDTRLPCCPSGTLPLPLPNNTDYFRVGSVFPLSPDITAS
jgi:hypothetical protein